MTTIGEKLRTRRQELGLSLRDIAARTGLTASFISLVERDQADPSIASLRKLAQALRTPLFHFFTNGELTSPVVRRDRRRRLVLPDSNIAYQMLSPNSSGNLVLYMAHIEPGGSSSDEPRSHPAEECTYVMQGRLQLEVGDEVYLLEEGDSVCWDGNLPHRLTSIGDQRLVLISAMTPPVF
jgi:transcriptional regulator with XRE-family HTH domain